MKTVAPHLNLLRDGERLSSSPIRLRVMGPVLAAFACVGCLVWWGVLGMQTMMVKTSLASVRADLDSKRAAHAEILGRMAKAREYEARIAQLEGYVAGRRTYGALLARLAEAVPEKVQLLSLSIPEPPAQVLVDPSKPKAPPLLGPADPTEAVSLRLLGRTTNSKPVNDFMERLRADAFTNELVRVEQPESYPKINAFRQETGGEGAARLLQFDIEYRCAERRFAK